jgi:hypothetical protein
MTMKKVASYLLWVGILTTLANSAFAETRTISWDPVTMYTDGTPIEAVKTVSYTSYWTTDPGLGSLAAIATAITATSTTFDPGVQGMTRGETVYFTAMAVLNTGEESALSPAYAWVVPVDAPPPVPPPTATLSPDAPKNIGLNGPVSSGGTQVWRLTWDPVTSYTDAAPLAPGRTVQYIAYWTDDPALSAASLKQLSTAVADTDLDFDPTRRMMTKNQKTYLTVRAILDTGEESPLSAALLWVAANEGPTAPSGGSVKKKNH